MSRTFHDDELIELLAPFAINAVEPDERTAVEAFLQAHPEYQDEVDEYRSAAALLAAGHRDAPPSVWERIQNSIEPSAPPLRLIDEHVSAQHTARRFKRLSVGLSIAAAVLAVTLGAVLVKDRTSAPSDLANLAAAARSETNTREVNLTSTSGGSVASVVVTADGHGFVQQSSLPELPEGKTYQLWAFTDRGEPISIAVLGRTVPESAFMAVAQVKVLAITVEDAGGVVSPSGSPVASAAFT